MQLNYEFRQVSILSNHYLAIIGIFIMPLHHHLFINFVDEQAITTRMENSMIERGSNNRT